MKGGIERIVTSTLLIFSGAALPIFGWSTPRSSKSTSSTSMRRPSLPYVLLKASQNVDDTAAAAPSSQKQAASFAASNAFVASPSSDCDNMNTPPSLQIISHSLKQLIRSGGSDIRGRFVDHAVCGSLALAVNAIRDAAPQPPPLTPFSAYCIGHALATLMLMNTEKTATSQTSITICIGMDPRSHGTRLADALARGAESVVGTNVVFTGIATTPACAAFCRLQKCDAAVMVTASHLPRDRNGFKFYSAAAPSGFAKAQIQTIGVLAEACALSWFQRGMLPPSSGEGAVMCSQHVNWMPDYAASLKQAILSKTTSHDERPLTGLKIILNPGNGAGGFFQDVLRDLGADVSASMHLEPDGTFPNGIPNPEDLAMLQQTLAACQEAQADLGIMLDTDADRCGFVVPRTVEASGERANYEALNRNRLIALLGVVFAREKPGCAVVTDSVTSEGLSSFLECTLGLKHVRYLKGYANVISKARELTESGTMNAELAIETSGHCAMRENGYLDDGTFTAVQIVSLLAREQAANDATNKKATLLDLIADLEELDEVSELRMTTKDGSLDTMREIFDICARAIERCCLNSAATVSGSLEEGHCWSIDQDNLEGIRVRLGHGQFFMLRKSLHDPIISLQIEARSKEEARIRIVQPLLKQLVEVSTPTSIDVALDLAVLRDY